MKRIAFLLLSLLCLSNSFAQTRSCCMPPAKGNKANTFALLDTKEFAAAHEAPLPFEYTTDRGSMVTFNTPDGKKASAFYVPSTAPTDKVLLIFHEWWGLNDYIKREAVRWQDSLGNVDVYAVDLFDGQVATTPEQAQKLSSGMDLRRGEAIVKGMVIQAGKDKLIATLGWCFGGSYSFTAAVAAGDQAKGCVMYYGFPEQDKKKIKPLKTDVFYVWGSKDNFITKDKVDAFGVAVRDAGRAFTLNTYDAVHAFANPSNPKHDAVAAADAETKTVAFLKKQLQLD